MVFAVLQGRKPRTTGLLTVFGLIPLLYGLETLLLKYQCANGISFNQGLAYLYDHAFDPDHAHPSYTHKGTKIAVFGLN